MNHDARTAHPLTEPSLAGDAFDELADLFLGDEAASGADADDRPARSVPATIERRALIVGHLPVSASAWVAQHARDLAASRGSPVAVISVSGDHASLAVYGSTKSTEAQPTLEAAIRAAHQLGIGAWLIRTDALSELALAEHQAITGVTLLTGADEAALVKAYRALKALTSAAPGYEPATPALHLAVLGSSEEAARPAAERLRKAVESFLDTGLTSVTLTPRIQAGSALRLFDGHAIDQIETIIDALPRHAAPKPEAPRRNDPILATPSVPAPPPAAPQTPLRLAHTDAHNASRIGPHTEYAEPPAARHEEPSPTPASSGEALAPLLGLTALEPRCPYADEVEIATDPEGRAHLLVHAAGGATAIPASLEALEIAKAWLSAHLTLIAAAAQGAISVSPPREPAAHLIVDHAPSARRLLDAPVRVYVKADGHAESLCVPLN